MKEKQIGDLRLFWRSDGSEASFIRNYKVESLADALMMLKSLASAEIEDNSVYMNVGFIEVYMFDEEDGWHFGTLMNDCGEEVSELFKDMDNYYEATRDEFVKFIEENKDSFDFTWIEGGGVKLY